MIDFVFLFLKLSRVVPYYLYSIMEYVTSQETFQKRKYPAFLSNTYIHFDSIFSMYFPCNVQNSIT